MIQEAVSGIQNGAMGVMLLAAAASDSTPGSDGPAFGVPTGNLTTWLLAGGLVWIVTGVFNAVTKAVINFKTQWRAADSGTDHQAFVDCQKQRVQDAATIERMAAENQSAWRANAEKDKQIAAMLLQINSLMAIIAGNSKNLIDQLAKAPAKSSDEIPVAPRIEPPAGEGAR